MPDRQVPVIVTYTHRHVVWVDAPGLADGQDMPAAVQAARDSIADYAYELTDDHTTLAEAGWDVSVPDAWDYQDTIYGYPEHPGAGLPHDAHVVSHRSELARLQREADRVACVAAGHPQQYPPLSDGRRWCPGCIQYLAPAPAATAEGGAPC